MRAIRHLASVAVVLLATAAAVTPASAATTTTRWVDNDGHAGPNGCGGSATAATKIQTAVDNSNQDDVVIVCPGTYVEQVTIKGNRDGLTLRASTRFEATIKAPSSLDSSEGFTYLVLIDHVDGVMVRGFKIIVRTQAPCSPVQGTVVVAGSQQVSIRGNRIMAPGSSTGDCIQYDGIVATEATQLGAPDARTTSVMIGYNEVRDAVNLAIGAFGTTHQVKLDIVHNSIRAYFGQPPAGTSGSAGVAGSPSTGDYGIGLFGRTKATIRNNVIQGASSGPVNGPYFYAGIGIQPDNGPNTGPNINGPMDIRDNIIRRVIYGIYLASADELTVRRNQVTNNYVGIDLYNVTGSAIRRNEVGSRDAGIRVDASSSGDTLVENTVSGAGGNCTDASSGSGTSGTANQWTDNTATQGSTPSGICEEP